MVVLGRVTAPYGVQGWVRLYYREMQNDCDGCIKWSEDQFVAAAEDHRASTFMELKIKHPLAESVEHVSVGTASLGARLGKTALVAKARIFWGPR